MHQRGKNLGVFFTLHQKLIIFLCTVQEGLKKILSCCFWLIVDDFLLMIFFPFFYKSTDDFFNGHLRWGFMMNMWVDIFTSTSTLGSHP